MGMANIEQKNIIVGGKYRLLYPIGQGSFGELYCASCVHTDEHVAVKLEKCNKKCLLLAHEAKVYKILRGGIGIPRIRYFGCEGSYNVLVVDLLGPTLEDLLNFCSRNFSVKTTIMLADQILTRVEYLHLNCLVHRDIKPENFLMGLGDLRTRVYMIDFGLAKRFYWPNTRKHIAYNVHHELIGTARYASLHAHFAEQSRRDDLESVGYLLIYFLQGQLPWQGITANTMMQKYEKIGEKKGRTSLIDLCAGIPTEFYLYMKYCRSLHFTEQPDYMYLRQLFTMLLSNSMMIYDYLYDWIDINTEIAKRNRAIQDENAKRNVKRNQKTMIKSITYKNHEHRLRSRAKTPTATAAATTELQFN